METKQIKEYRRLLSVNGNIREDTGHTQPLPLPGNGALQLPEGRWFCSAAISYTSGAGSASSGSPTCIGFAHLTRAAQNSVELILVMVVQMLQQARRG